MLLAGNAVTAPGPWAVGQGWRLGSRGAGRFANSLPKGPFKAKQGPCFPCKQREAGASLRGGDGGI